MPPLVVRAVAVAARQHDLKLRPRGRHEVCGHLAVAVDRIRKAEHRPKVLVLRFCVDRNDVPVEAELPALLDVVLPVEVQRLVDHRVDVTGLEVDVHVGDELLRPDDPSELVRDAEAVDLPPYRQRDVLHDVLVRFAVGAAVDEAHTGLAVERLRQRRWEDAAEPEEVLHVALSGLDLDGESVGGAQRGNPALQRVTTERVDGVVEEGERAVRAVVICESRGVERRLARHGPCIRLAGNGG